MRLSSGFHFLQGCIHDILFSFIVFVDGAEKKRAAAASVAGRSISWLRRSKLSSHTHGLQSRRGSTGFGRAQVKTQFPVVGENDRSLDGILELANVSRPGVSA